MINTILKIIADNDLGQMVQWILENNPSQSLPYHNFNHSLYVAYYAYNAFVEESYITQHSYDEHVEFKKIKTKKCPKALLIAALFHDFGHTGGFATNDTINVEIARNAWAQFCDLYITHHGRHGLKCDNYLFLQVDYLIECTKYPHEHVSPPMGGNFEYTAEDRDFQMRCLRDADFMQNCNETVLANQVGIKSESFKHVPYAEYVEKCLNFLRGIKYTTTYGKTFGAKKLQTAIKQLELFQRLVFPTN